MAQYYFAAPLGAQKKDIVAGTSSTAAAAVELRIDEAQITTPQGRNDILTLVETILQAVDEAQRY